MHLTAGLKRPIERSASLPACGFWRHPGRQLRVLQHAFSLPTTSVLLPALLVLTLLASGCGETAKPATAISVDQIPAELGKAFASASGDARELSTLAATAVQNKEFPKAATTLEALAQRADLSKLQSRTTAGAAMTVNALLLEAESKGDARAAETLDLRRKTK